MSFHAGGDIAQLGERCVRNAEVVGSIPIISTTSNWLFRSAFHSQNLPRYSSVLYCFNWNGQNFKYGIWKRTIRRTKKSGAAPVENLSSLLHVTERLAVASMSQKVWGCQKKYSNHPPHDKTQVLVFTAGFLALYFVYALRKWLQVKKRPTFLRARDRVDANTQEGRITK